MVDMVEMVDPRIDHFDHRPCTPPLPTSLSVRRPAVDRPDAEARRPGPSRTRWQGPGGSGVDGVLHTPLGTCVLLHQAGMAPGAARAFCPDLTEGRLKVGRRP